MSLGPLEILVILVMALLVFGPKRLPEVGRQVGGALRELRRMQEQVRSELGSVLTVDGDEKPSKPSTASSTPTPEADREPDHDEGLPPPASEPSETEPPSSQPSPVAGFEGPSGSFV